MFGTSCPANDKVIAQGGAVYDEPLHRYIFSSWSCSTHELYEAPEPWGPWSHISAGTDSTSAPPATNDFGPIRLIRNRGQYGTSIPSKYISSDGRTMYLQSNVCCGGNSYTFSLRKLRFTTYEDSVPGNRPSNDDLSLAPGTRAIGKSTHFGSLCGLNCSDHSAPDMTIAKTITTRIKAMDWWGYIWPRSYNLDQVAYTTGTMFPDGGWYAKHIFGSRCDRISSGPMFGGATVNPSYPYSSDAGAQTRYIFSFPHTWGDGVRIIGTPGGTHTFTSISQLIVTYGATSLPVNVNLVQDPGFEQQQTSAVSSPWSTEGPDAHGIDLNLAFSHSGNNDAWIRDSTSNWNATTQVITVQPNTNYTLTGWVQNNFTTNVGYFGVRDSGGVNVIAQKTFSGAPITSRSLSPSTPLQHHHKVFAGFWGHNADYWVRLDDFRVH